MHVPSRTCANEILGKGNEHNNSPSCYMSSQGDNECVTKRIVEWKKTNDETFQGLWLPCVRTRTGTDT